MGLRIVIVQAVDVAAVIIIAGLDDDIVIIDSSGSSSRRRNRNSSATVATTSHCLYREGPGGCHHGQWFVEVLCGGTGTNGGGNVQTPNKSLTDRK